VSVRRVTTVLAGLFVEERLSDADDPSFRIWSDSLDIQVRTWQVAQRVARTVLAGSVITYSSSLSETFRHHEWNGERDDVKIRVVAVGPLDEPSLDPLDAVDEDDYLERLIRLGLVVDDAR
jgi:hypothetical protein